MPGMPCRGSDICNYDTNVQEPIRQTRTVRDWRDLDIVQSDGIGLDWHHGQHKYYGLIGPVCVLYYFMFYGLSSKYASKDTN